MSQPSVRKLGDERRHYWLALGMAESSGADLQRALEAGRITHADWANVVERCRGCGWSEGCDCWLKARDPGSAPVPQACPNVAFFEKVCASQSED